MKRFKGIGYLTISMLLALSVTSCKLTNSTDNKNNDNTSDTDNSNTDGNKKDDTSTDNSSKGDDSKKDDTTGGNTSGGDSSKGDTTGGDTAVVTYTITFDTNGGTEIASITINKDSCIQNLSAPTKDGYVFDGWYLDKSFTTVFNTTTKITSNLTLYAKWDAKAAAGEVVSSLSGYAEGLYAKFSETEPSSSAIKVEVRKSSETSWTRVDNELIQRESDSLARVDVLGLSAGLYDLKITNSEGKCETRTNIQVTSYDRSGYAHFNKTDGVGAYNDDGTLKSNAVVVYVNDSNKNTVKATIAGKEYTGIANIMQAQYKSSYPLVVRFLGSVKTTQWDYIDTATVYGAGKTSERVSKQNKLFDVDGWGSNKLTESAIISAGLNSMSNDINNGITAINGLTNRINRKTDSDYDGMYVYDSYFNDLDVLNAKNVTVEGVGEDAELYQWGFTFSKCNSLEVRNLTFSNYTEDAIGIQGGSNTDMNYSGFWIHNSTFNRGLNNWDVTDENDKEDGDGSTDFKYAHNLTISYVRYNKTHKTSLIGGGDDHCQYNLTMHHNFYNQCSSRQPLLRQANVHMYNNYYYKSSTAQDIRANAFAYSEYNYFDNCIAAQKVTTEKYLYTAIKSYNDYYDGSKNTSAATKVSERTTAVAGLCKPDNGTTDYTNFDTNSSLFYYDSVNKVTKVSYLSTAAQAKLDCQNYAGASSKYNVLSTSDSTTSDSDSSDTTTKTFTVVSKEDFSSNVDVTTLTSNNVPSNAGIYLYTDASDTTKNYLKVNDGQLLIYDDTTSTTYGYYIYNEAYNSGVARYSIDFIPQTENTKWGFISFITSDNQYITLVTDGAKKINVTYGETTKESGVLLEASKTYTIILTVDYTNGTMTISINGTEVSIESSPSIKGIKFTTAAANSRSFLVDNIIVEKKN